MVLLAVVYVFIQHFSNVGAFFWKFSCSERHSKNPVTSFQLTNAATCSILALKVSIRSRDSIDGNKVDPTKSLRQGSQPETDQTETVILDTVLPLQYMIISVHFLSNLLKS